MRLTASDTVTLYRPARVHRGSGSANAELMSESGAYVFSPVGASPADSRQQQLNSEISKPGKGLYLPQNSRMVDAPFEKSQAHTIVRSALL